MRTTKETASIIAITPKSTCNSKSEGLNMGKAIMNYGFLVVFLSLGLALGVANADIYEGLVAHWTFDESSGNTASDFSGNGHDGTLVSMDDSNWVEGKVGNALDFDGTDTYVAVGDVGEYSDISITLWVNIDSLPVDSAVRFNSGSDSGAAAHERMLRVVDQVAHGSGGPGPFGERGPRGPYAGCPDSTGSILLGV